jgi:hypothetical protein
LQRSKKVNHAVVSSCTNHLFTFTDDDERMTSIAYILLLVIALMFSVAAGFIAHHVRAHFTFSPERVTGSDVFDQALSGEDILFESQVVGAQWDENGFWDVNSNRNLIYYVVSLAGATLLAWLWFWPDRAKIVGLFCKFTTLIGLDSPLC